MKRVIVLFLLAALLLVGCGSKETQQPQEPYTQSINGVDYYVDPDAKTITAGGHTFHYAYIENGVRVTYPNGEVVTESYNSNGMGGISWSDMELSKYGVDCYDLLDAVPRQVKEEEKGEMAPLIFIGIAVIALGTWEAACPYTHWNWMYGWRYKDAEPSDEALGRIAAAGIIEIIGGVIFVLIGIFA